MSDYPNSIWVMGGDYPEYCELERHKGQWRDNRDFGTGSVQYIRADIVKQGVNALESAMRTALERSPLVMADALAFRELLETPR